MADSSGTIAETDQKVFDLCVVGTGPAGIILALEYARKNPDQTIFLAEFGESEDLGQNALDDSILNVNPANHHDPYECSNKGLGGTSITWGGRCVMYDEVDFEDRAVVNDGCTWGPEILDQIKSHLPRTAEYFECGAGPFSTDEMTDWKDKRIAEGFEQGDVLDSRVERWSMPTRFGARYKDELMQAENLTLRYNSEARDFSAPNAGGEIDCLQFRDRKTGECFAIKARNFVLAAGAQESTRMLLRNPKVFNNLECSPDALGRYYQGHVSGKIATVCFDGDPGKTDYGFQQGHDGSYFRRRFQLHKDTILDENLLNTAIWLDNPLYHDPSHQSGAMSVMYLAMITPIIGKRLAPPAIANSITKGKVTGLTGHLWNVIRGLPGSLFSPANIFFRRYCLKRKLPGICLFSRANQYALHFHGEQIPDRDNRMQLSDDGETLEIHYGLMDQDISSVIRTHEILDHWLRKCNCGRLKYWFDKDQLPSAIREMSRDGIHQCGTTRIAQTPDEGVVDANLRVWGTGNLYVCSSSAFPTSGQANPTFLLGAFAVRLAHHLSK